MEIDKELKKMGGMAAGYGNIGLVYYHKKQYDEPLIYNQKSLDIIEELNDKVGMLAPIPK